MTAELFTDDLIRTISKTGEFDLVSPDALDWACSLEDVEKIALYCRIRDEAGRLEDEWRDDFVDEMEMDEELLPRPEF